MDHMAYPASGTFDSRGPCPASHPVPVPQLMYETVWDTRRFNNPEDWPEDGSQPFVWSFGDQTVSEGDLPMSPSPSTFPPSPFPPFPLFH
ncbi:putative carbohydrate-binding module family 1 protein [Rosellinia necatrix]|uniref:Putative carbohydrate-binding module family 1 protein n=1 Tax=Rosellinia necatrix TaxID=77044 RepID=A0A1S8A9L7_ROSNE|nr:putative carbohydrate-binding module family 1 protein [Rosellinia necatrix]